jgi:hypothetical protein
VFGSHSRCILTPLLQLVHTIGIYSLPSCNWCTLQVYAHFLPVIGSHSRCILTPLLQLVHTIGIYSLPSCNWCTL